MITQRHCWHKVSMEQKAEHHALFIIPRVDQRQEAVAAVFCGQYVVFLCFVRRKRLDYSRIRNFKSCFMRQPMRDKMRETTSS